MENTIRGRLSNLKKDHVISFLFDSTTSNSLRVQISNFKKYYALKGLKLRFSTDKENKQYFVYCEKLKVKGVK